ncbi:MAG: GatB/YqeY domain-containing protein, partial [Marmoricola sp.]
FADAGREEQAAKEKAEAAVIAGYLPEQLTAEEIDALVTETIDELGVRGDGMKAMGRVMGVLTPRTKGRADGGAVAAAVRRELAS